MRKSLLSLGFLLLASPAFSETLQQFVEKATAGETTRQLMINSSGESYSWANGYLEMNKQPPLYCQPAKLPLTADNYIRILKDWIEKVDAGKEQGNKFQFHLLMALQSVFPCNQ